MARPRATAPLAGRYGVLWAYDYEGEGISVSGVTQSYVRAEALEFHFCPICGCAFWRGQKSDRLAEPQAVAKIPIDHFDGLNTFKDLGRDGRCVGDYWF